MSTKIESQPCSQVSQYLFLAMQGGPTRMKLIESYSVTNIQTYCSQAMDAVAVCGHILGVREAATE